jgi:hypothetical protein
MMTVSVKNTLFRSPLFRPLWPALELFNAAQVIPTIHDLNLLITIPGIRFVLPAPKAKAFADGYEARIFLRGEVQTRENSWHDFFNALVWHAFPSVKRTINYLHYELHKSRYPNKNRLPAENMLTIFDEHGAIITSKNTVLLELIKERRWHDLFWKDRERLQAELQIVIFGHGLYEKALKPYLGLCAHALLLHSDEISSLEGQIVQFLIERGCALRTKDLIPVPILGYPGWWPETNDENFYFNTAYFRPHRK